MKAIFQQIQSLFKGTGRKQPLLIIYLKDGTFLKAIGKDHSHVFFTTHLFSCKKLVEHQDCLVLHPVHPHSTEQSSGSPITIALPMICGFQWVNSDQIENVRACITANTPLELEHKTDIAKPMKRRKAATQSKNLFEQPQKNTNKASTTPPSSVVTDRDMLQPKPELLVTKHLETVVPFTIIHFDHIKAITIKPYEETDMQNSLNNSE